MGGRKCEKGYGVERRNLCQAQRMGGRTVHGSIRERGRTFAKPYDNNRRVRRRTGRFWTRGLGAPCRTRSGFAEGLWADRVDDLDASQLVGFAAICRTRRGRFGAV